MATMANMAGPLLPRQSTTPSSGSSGSDSTDQLLKLLSDPFQASLQTNAFWASLGIYLPLTALLAIVFLHNSTSTSTRLRS